MTLFKINNTKIRIDISVLFLCILWICAGKISTFLTMIFAVLLHESFHAFVAYLFGFSTESIEVFPFGGEAQIRGIEDNYIYEAIVASAGPFISLLTGFLWEKFIPIKWNEFVEFSYSIAMINLLPVYPLDGGRMLTAVFKGIWGEIKGRRRAVTLSVIIASVYLLKCLYDTIKYRSGQGIVMAVFMLTAALKAIKNPRRIGFREKYWKSENVKIIKAYGDKSVLEILKDLNGSFYYCVLAVDNNEEILGIFTEKQLFDGIMKNNSITLKELNEIRPLF